MTPGHYFILALLIGTDLGHIRRAIEKKPLSDKMNCLGAIISIALIILYFHL